MKKMEIERKLYSVTTRDEYDKTLYNPKTTALEIGDLVLPIRNPNIDTGVGVYMVDGYMVANVVKPDKSCEAEYSRNKIMDFSNAKTVGEIIDMNNLLSHIQQDLMVSGKDNILTLTITPQDTPEMKALKTAINSKQIDKKAYESRFDQFQNNMRLLKGPSITLAKMKEICEGFDIACELTLTDKEGAVNPIGTEIVVDLTEGRATKE